MTDHNHSRRRFIGNMLSMAGSSAIPFTLNLAAMGTVAAQTASDYKALVCVFLNGGNDSFNTLLPTDSASWSEYIRLRASADTNAIALAAAGLTGGVLPISPATSQGGRTFALHPQLAALKPIFDNSRLAMVANVGTLIRPTTLADYQSGAVPVPSKLFSHNDQQATWQSLQLEGSKAAAGWGGRLGDIMGSANGNAAFTAISMAGDTIFLSGRTVRQYQIGKGGVVPIWSLQEKIFGLPVASSPLRQIVTGDHTNLFQKEHAAVVSRAIAAQSVLSGAMLPAGTGGVPNPPVYINPNTLQAEINPLASQLQTVARIIGARGALSQKRQVFYVMMPGFDTHDDQRKVQNDLLAKLAHAMAYFDSAMASLQGTDMRKQVTLFTASDFGRTLTSNGDGTDHGWGAHHFIMGGAVKGRDIYGSVPVMGLNHSLDVGSGSLLPTISVDQYGATLASWFGLSATQIADVFPNIANFSTRNLGFMA
jgi:uncharacterized protein (DUF1501 family)